MYRTNIAFRFIGHRRLSHCLLLTCEDWTSKTKYAFKMTQSVGSSFETLQAKHTSKCGSRYLKVGIWFSFFFDRLKIN